MEFVGHAASVEQLLTTGTDAGLVVLDLSLRNGSRPSQNVERLHARGIGVLVVTSGENPYLTREVSRSGVSGIVRKSAAAEDIIAAIAEQAREHQGGPLPARDGGRHPALPDALVTGPARRGPHSELRILRLCTGVVGASTLAATVATSVVIARPDRVAVSTPSVLLTAIAIVLPVLAAGIARWSSIRTLRRLNALVVIEYGVLAVARGRRQAHAASPRCGGRDGHSTNVDGWVCQRMGLAVEEVDGMALQRRRDARLGLNDLFGGLVREDGDRDVSLSASAEGMDDVLVPVAQRVAHHNCVGLVVLQGSVAVTEVLGATDGAHLVLPGALGDKERSSGGGSRVAAREVK